MILGSPQAQDLMLSGFLGQGLGIWCSSQPAHPKILLGIHKHISSIGHGFLIM